MRRSLAILALVLLSAASARAQDLPPPVFGGGDEPPPAEPEARSTETGTPLSVYLDALSQRRLLAAETGSVERLRELVAHGEQLYLDGSYDRAALLLFEVAESPRFADFVGNDEFKGAELMLARSLQHLGALRTAMRYLERILGRGTDDVYFGPAFRTYVDVALSTGDPGAQLERVEALELGELPEDSANELHYLGGRASYDDRDWAGAEERLARITRHSRWFASAQYLRGTAEARQGHLDEAEALFCSIATQGDQDRYTFFVDDRYFEVKDLARLALGRVAHEGGRADDAFYYYFQVPADSARVSEALFEAAYSMYEGGDMETAIDLLDQLETRFPESPFVDEAALLRGYVHLGRCEFEEADRLFRRFNTQFEPVVHEIDAILETPARQQGIYEELLAEEVRAEERRRAGEPAVPDIEEREGENQTRSLLLAMLRVEPAFYRVHADVRMLDAESGRAGRLSTELGEILARVSGSERPVAAAEEATEYDEQQQVRRDLDAGKALAQSLVQQLDAMRRAGAPATEIRPLEQEIRALSRRLAELEGRFREAMGAGSDGGGPAAASTDDFEALLAADVEAARRLPRRVAATRGRMVEAANETAIASLQTLRRRLGASLRRARIGRIDAVMGSKRRIEIQIESLAAGRFPPELMDPLRVQGLLRDDEEYWPFEGELWQDEFIETDPLDEGAEDEEGDGGGDEGSGGDEGGGDERGGDEGGGGSADDEGGGGGGDGGGEPE